jgi:hypothetical protein
MRLLTISDIKIIMRLIKNANAYEVDDSPSEALDKAIVYEEKVEEIPSQGSQLT